MIREGPVILPQAGVSGLLSAVWGAPPGALQVATSPNTEGNSYSGLAIGFTVASGVIAVGGLSGGAFNPAVGIGPALIHTALGGGSMGSVWIYLAAPLLGGVAAAAVYRLQDE